jgi:hypothetical protein
MVCLGVGPTYAIRLPPEFAEEYVGFGVAVRFEDEGPWMGGSGACMDGWLGVDRI